MRVGIDYRSALLKRSGIGRYARELVRAMASVEGDHQISLYAHFWKRPLFSEAELGLEGSRVRLHRKRVPSRWMRLLHRFGNVGVESFLPQIEIFHYTDFVYPPLRSVPFLATIHDTAFLEAGFFPERSAEVLRERTLWALERSQLVLVPSTFTAGELVMRLGGNPSKIVVTPLGSEHAAAVRQEPRTAEDPYFLTVGTIEPRKNHLRILTAFEELRRKGFPYRWVVAGAKGWLYEPFFEKLARSPAREFVEIREDCDDRELAALYAAAEFLVYPSLYEGFGLPPLEAMRRGVPVLTSGISALPEVCGEAAVYVDPRSEASLLENLQRLIEDEKLRSNLRRAGLERAARFSWDDTARATLAAYRGALAGTTGSLRRFF